jgi:hypothetical protein
MKNKTYFESDQEMTPPPEVTREPSRDMQALAAEIRKGPIWLHTDVELMDPKHSIPTPLGKTMIAGLIPGRNFAFSFTLDDERHAAEIALLHEACASVPHVEPIMSEFGHITRPFTISHRAEKDEAFRQMEHGNGAAWDAYQSAQPNA